jgi:N-acetylglucosamine kinase
MHIGIDVGGTKIELAIFDADLLELRSWREATPTDNYSLFIRTVASMVAVADNHSGTRETVGISLPGMIGEKLVKSSPNIPCLNDKAVVPDLESKIGLRIGVGNDATNFALSEANGGAADGVSRVVGIILGTGLGGGLCIDAEAYVGANNLAGEWGHLQLPAVIQQRHDLPLRPCGCGAVGCIEQYFSGPGLAWLHEHLTGRQIEVSDLIGAMRDGDTDAMRVFDAYIDGLGICMSQLLVLYDPDIIVLGGGLSKVPEILARLPDAFPDAPYAGKILPEIVPARFGDSSGVRGAAILGQRLNA